MLRDMVTADTRQHLSTGMYVRLVAPHGGLPAGAVGKVVGRYQADDHGYVVRFDSTQEYVIVAAGLELLANNPD